MEYNNQGYSFEYSNIPTPNNINMYDGILPQQNPSDMPHVDSLMHDFNDAHRAKFNDYWFVRNDDDLVEGMKKIILSCQRDKYFVLRVLDFEVIRSYTDIIRILSDYNASKSKNSKKSELGPETINLRDSDVMLLKVTYYVKLNIPEEKIRKGPTGKTEQTEGIVTTLITLPVYVDRYFYRLLGKRYNPVYQIVDASTYNNNTSSNARVSAVTEKTNFMPIKMYKEYDVLVDTVSKEACKCVLYTCYVFTKKTDAIKFILGRYGYYGALEMLELEGIYLQPTENTEPKNPNIYYNFEDEHGRVRLSVYRDLFNRDTVTQSFCFTVLKNVKKIENFADIFDPRYWNRALGADFQSATLDKGIPVLDSFESIYDLQTKDITRLPEEEKQSSYYILRWMLREFNYLKQKNNLDISTKRARGPAEYIPAIYAKKLSTGIYRISDIGKSVTFKDVVRVIDTAPDYIIKQLVSMSNIMPYSDIVNDNDALVAMAFTYKGISGLGDGSKSSVPDIYKSVHPSHLGILDLEDSSSSDPGLSGSIAPTAKVHNGSFSEFEEPLTWKGYYTSMLKEFREMHNIIQALEFKGKIGLSYDYLKEDMVRETITTYERIIPGLSFIGKEEDFMKGARVLNEDEIAQRKAKLAGEEVIEE